MNKWTSLAVAVGLVLATCAYAFDEVGQTDAAKTAKYGKTAPSAAGHSGCSRGDVAEVMAGLPQMTYKVGDLETPCFKTAVAEAGDESKVKYVVDGKTYDCKERGTFELASLLEEEADNMMTVQYVVGDKSVYCPMAAKSLAEASGGEIAYRLAGMDFDSKDQAEAAAVAVREAVAKLASGSETVAADKPGCGAKAATVAGEGRCGPDCTKPCCADKTAAAKSGCKPGCGAKAKTVAGKGGCGPDCTKPCCAGKAATVETAAAKPACCGSKDKGTAEKAACCTAKGETASGTAEAGCGAQAQKRLGAVMAKLRLIVETGAKVRSS